MIKKKPLPFQFWIRDGELNYWDCVSRRLQNAHKGSEKDFVWREQAKDTAWEMHKDLICRIHKLERSL